MNGGVPFQVPLATLSTRPSTASPVVGTRPLCLGASAAITALGAERASSEPSPFDAVTATASRCPTSAGVRRYLLEAAPAIGSHSAPEESQRSQL